MSGVVIERSGSEPNLPNTFVLWRSWSCALKLFSSFRTLIKNQLVNNNTDVIHQLININNSVRFPFYYTVIADISILLKASTKRHLLFFSLQLQRYMNSNLKWGKTSKSYFILFSLSFHAVNGKTTFDNGQYIYIFTYMQSSSSKSYTRSHVYMYTLTLQKKVL